MNKVEVLFQDGYFRIIRDDQSVAYVQHEHTTAPENRNSFNDGRWVYCYFNHVVHKITPRSDMRCMLCETPVPLEMQGMIVLMRWER
jgi:hypothetical protein